MINALQQTDLKSLNPPSLLERAELLQQEVNSLRSQLAQVEGELKQAERIAYYDALTSLPNRHGYDKYVSELQKLVQKPEFIETTHGGRKGGLLVVEVDIDYFKSVNSMVTHFGGDVVLKEFAARLASTLRANADKDGGNASAQSLRQLPNLMLEHHMLHHGLQGMDLVSRWGGEEFFCLLPQCYAHVPTSQTVYDNADKVINRLLNAIRSRPLTVPISDKTYQSLRQNVIGRPDHYYGAARLMAGSDGQKLILPITASMGYTLISWEEFMAVKSQDATHLFRNVADLLRRAKDSGRNRAITVRASANSGTPFIHTLQGTSQTKMPTAFLIDQQNAGD